MEREVIVEQGDADLPGADPLAVDRDVPRTELTAVGRGTPMGELLRRNWHPVGLVGDATEIPSKVRARRGFDPVP